MKPPQITKLRLPTYKASLWIVVHTSLPKAIDYLENLIDVSILKSKERNSVRAYTFAYQDDRGRRRFILFLRPSCQPGEIAHECKHLVNIVFSWYGVRLSISNDEPECYYLEDIVNMASRAVNKSKKKLTPKVKPNEIIIEN